MCGVSHASEGAHEADRYACSRDRQTGRHVVLGSALMEAARAAGGLVPARRQACGSVPGASTGMHSKAGTHTFTFTVRVRRHGDS